LVICDACRTRSAKLSLVQAEPAPVGRRQRRAQATRAALVEAALDLFEEQGYVATSIDDIAEAADVARRTFFRYFPSKESVLLPEAADYDTAFAAALASEPLPLTVHAIARAFIALAEQMQADEQLHRRERIIRDHREHFRSFTQLRIESGREQLGQLLATRIGCAADDTSVLTAVDLGLLAFAHGYMQWFDAGSEGALVDPVARSFELTIALASGARTIGS